MASRCGGRSESDSTRTPVWTVPPREVSSDASAVVMADDPPAATGHPTAWPAVVSVTPTAADASRSRGCTRWAAEPANNARAASVEKRRANVVAGSPARSPKRAMATGWRGMRSNGPSASAVMVSKLSTSGPKLRRQAGPSAPRPATVSSSDRHNTAAEPSSRGWARSTSGQHHVRPWSASGSDERYGDPTPSGWTAEQMSWARPGTVSSAVRVPPPISSAASSTVTDSPAVARVTAAARPLGPAPITTASQASCPEKGSGPEEDAGPAGVIRRQSCPRCRPRHHR